MPETKKKTSGLLQNIKEFTAGTVAGWVQVIVGQPFDIVKVRLQTQTTAHYKGAGDCFMQILKQEGPMAFYKGTLSPLLGVGAAVSIQFGVNEMCKRVFGRFKDSEGRLGYHWVFLSGALAGVANASVLAPVEHIRIRMQIQKAGEAKLYTGSIDCVQKIYRKYGISGVYKATVSTCAREFIAFGFYFLGYDWYMRTITPKGKTFKDIAWYHPLIGGSIAGYGYWLSCYPIDLLKSKLQADSFENPKYKNLKDCYNQTKAGGAKAFYKGLLPCLLRAMPVNAATFLCFEMVLDMLGGRQE